MSAYSQEPYGTAFVEENRLALLHRLALLDTPPEEVFDRVTRLATMILGVPIALVSLVDESRQWFKSKVGLTVDETPRSIAFCPYTLDYEDMMVVPDATRDPRFRDTPLVTGDPMIRFYAGVPLRSSDGLPMGTLCIIDTKPRVLSAQEAQALRDLAAIVRRELLQREISFVSANVQHADRRALDESKALFQAAFQQAAVGFLVISLDGHLLQINPRFTDMLGYTAPQELMQQHYQALLAPENVADADRDITRLMAGEIQYYSSERLFRRKDDSRLWATVTVALARTTNGEPLHFVSVVQDISDRKAADEALQALHMDLEARVTRRTTELQSVNLQLAAVIAERDKTIAARLQTEEALRSSRESLQTITDNLPVLIAYVDDHLRYQFNNETYREIFGCAPAAMQGRLVADAIAPAVFETLLPYYQRALSGQKVVCDDVVFERIPHRVWSATYIPHWKNGQVNGFYAVSYDVTERKRLEVSLTEQALQDALTQLPNRRALLTRLDAAMSQDVRLAVLFLDLDGFKQVNDRFGHEVGDLLLLRFAERLKTVVSSTDVVARLAGDEFVIVLLNLGATQSPAAEARCIAESIISALSTPFDITTPPLHIATSVGIALFDPSSSVPLDQIDKTDAVALLAKADRAMYAAKLNAHQNTQQNAQRNTQQTGIAGQSRYCFADTNDR